MSVSATAKPIVQREQTTESGTVVDFPTVTCNAQGELSALTGVGWPVFRICGFPAKPFVDSRFASSPERRIFLADDLSDIALAVTVEPQVIGAILHGTLLFVRPWSSARWD